MIENKYVESVKSTYDVTLHYKGEKDFCEELESLRNQLFEKYEK